VLDLSALGNRVEGRLVVDSVDETGHKSRIAEDL
jgi:hypothetical protein